MTSTTTDVAIIGGGLSGLAVANGLFKKDVDFILIEARDRVGGRVLSETPVAGSGRFDLGPAWVWPHNHKILALLETISGTTQRQYAQGHLVFEDAQGHLRRDLDFAMMGAALRIVGGTDHLIRALVDPLPDHRLLLNHMACHIARNENGFEISTTSAQRLRARRIVLALPPRLWATQISFAPQLPTSLATALTAIPTWMAAHAKFLAVYDHAFWRAAGLSGDAISHIGPLAEVHDASDAQTGTPALFGFVGDRDRADIETRGLAQLVRMFGPDAASPQFVLVKDWASDPHTSIPADTDPPDEHPTYGLPHDLQTWAGPDMHFAGTESARYEGGFLEGALEAAENVLAHLLT